MKRGATTYDAALRAFRAVTGDVTEGAAARARLMASAERRMARTTAGRRALFLTAAPLLLVAFASGAVAWTLAGRWRAVLPRVVDTEMPARSSEVADRHHIRRPTRVIPPVAPVAEPSSSAADGDGDLAAYARAHRAHFVDDAPARALAAWEAYLSSHPAGTFAPEAAYNRAVCLARLGKLVEASAAFRPFARGRFHGYRREEARRLLDWLADRAAVRRSP